MRKRRSEYNLRYPARYIPLHIILSCGRADAVCNDEIFSDGGIPRAARCRRSRNRPPSGTPRERNIGRPALIERSTSRDIYCGVSAASMLHFARGIDRLLFWTRTTHIFFVLGLVHRRGAGRRFAHESDGVLAVRHIRASESILVSETLFAHDKHRPPIRFPATVCPSKCGLDPEKRSEFLGGKSHSKSGATRAVSFVFE